MILYLSAADCMLPGWSPAIIRPCPQSVQTCLRVRNPKNAPAAQIKQTMYLLIRLKSDLFVLASHGSSFPVLTKHRTWKKIMSVMDRAKKAAQIEKYDRKSG